MITQKTQLEIKVKDQNHIYECQPNCPLDDCLEALDTFRFYVIGRKKENDDLVKANAQAQNQESLPAPEEIKEDPKPEGA